MSRRWLVFRYLFVAVIVCCYMHSFAVSASSLDSAQRELQPLINQAKISVGLSNSDDMLTQLSDNFEAYYLKHKNSLASPEGQKLNKQFTKWQNYLAIKVKFERCFEGFDRRRPLDQRILELAKALPLDDFDCGPHGYTRLTDQINAVGQAISYDYHVDYERQLVQQVQENAAINMADMMYRVQDKKMSNRALAARIGSILCNSGCGKNQRQQLRAVALRRINKLQQDQVKQSSYADTANHFNIALSDLNTQYLLPISYATKAQAKQVYDSYASRYWQLTSNKEGLLLHGRYFNRRVGGLKKFATSETKSGGFKLKNSPHKPRLNKQDIARMRREYIYDMTRMGVDINKKLDSKRNLQQRRKSLKEMIRANPLAVAQRLIVNPQQAHFICELIKEMETEKQEAAARHSKRSRYILGGALMAVGMVITATVIGAGPGAVILGLGALTIGGGITAFEAGHSIQQLQGAHSEKQRISRAQSSGNTDQISYDDLTEENQRASDAILNLAIETGMTMTGSFIVLGVVKRTGKILGRTQVGKSLETSVKTWKNNRVLKRLQKGVTESEYAEFRAKLALLPMEEQKKMIALVKRLRSKKMSSDEIVTQFNAHYDEILAACRKS